MACTVVGHHPNRAICTPPGDERPTVSDMVIDESPIYEMLVRELGAPVQATPLDCSFAALLELAGSSAARSVEPVKPSAASAKVPAGRSADKPMAVVAQAG